ncbi:P-loop ATPase, Sll1717 family [Paractinoplanes atraurantiacus]|uniref:P-loop ATPase, Sll1717 family n=1 Tax=Paractinoplanes atraurantiacus TaxID=1036182 RepID=UPI0011780451|nr:transposase [Actinoplanes atraurantiacus]
MGASFAENDLVPTDPEVYVHTPPFDSAIDHYSGKYFYVGRRGTGKTALRTFCEQNLPHARAIVPEIFSPTSGMFDLELFANPKKGPFRALVSVFKRVLLGELLLMWREAHPTFATVPSRCAAELSGPCSDDFDTRTVLALKGIAHAVREENDEALISENKATKNLIEEMKVLQSGGKYTLLVDSIDDFWDASDQALTYLTAFLHASLEVSTQIPWGRVLVFLRENIFERVRARDSESSRLETSISGLGWNQRQLVELVERRLRRALVAKPALGGPTWEAFFEDGPIARKEILEFCHDRPRDVLIYVSHAIDSAKERGNEIIRLEDVEGARRKFSDNRLKDLGDEYAENFPQIALVLTRFYGLGRRFTVSGIEALIRGLLNDTEVKRLCASWIFDHQAPELFVRLLYNIGFVGIEKAGRPVKFRALGPQDTSPPAVDSDATIVVHRCYWDALDLQDSLVRELPDSTKLGRVGIVEELPGGLSPTDYIEHLEDLELRLTSIPLGHPGATQFENAIGDLLRLCFFRALDNVEARSRTVNGEAIRDWIAAIRAHTGFWSIIRQRYSATQVVWECKNYENLHSDDFQQISYYLNDTIGKFGIIAFRGEVQTSYMRHIERISRDRGAVVLPLGIRDLKTFIRQAKAGKLREAHIQDRYDATVRKIS